MDREFNVKIGKIVRWCRSSRALTQLDLAKMTGIERTHIAKIESGHTDVTAWKVEEILNALGYHLEAVED